MPVGSGGVASQRVVTAEVVALVLVHRRRGNLAQVPRVYLAA